MLSFDTRSCGEILSLTLLSKDSCKRHFKFEINGVIHGKPVFSEGLFYMIKGGKLVNCLLSRINGQLLEQIDEYRTTKQRQVEEFSDRYKIKIRDLPKSFGCDVSLLVNHKSRSYILFNQRLFQLAHDETGEGRQICSRQPYPFTVSNLSDFSAQIDWFRFVFNVNDTLLKENSFLNHQTDTPLISTDDVLPDEQESSGVKVLLSPHLLTILDALKFKTTFDAFQNETFGSNFEMLVRAVKLTDF